MTTDVYEAIPEIRNARDLKAFLDSKAMNYVKVGVFDVDGVLRGKYIHRDKLLSSDEPGFGFCDVVLGWDSNDQLYDNTRLTGWHTGYPDANVRLDLSSIRWLPFEPDMILLLGQFIGPHADACPRTILSRIVARCREMGFEPIGSCEYEFWMFRETPESARAKGYRDLEPWTPGNFGYSVLRSTVHHELYRDLLDTMEIMDVEIEGLHTETGPGVLEAAIKYDSLDRAGDKAALFKTFAKVIAQRQGLMATFMSKWNAAYPGQSGHIHISLVDKKTKQNVFYDPKAKHTMSPIMQHFLAGQVKLLPEILPLVCSTVNAYRRLVPGTWAPTASSWGVENRTTALRVIPGPKAQRVEFRIGPADANPHLAMAAALAAGLHGLEQKLELPPEIVGNAYKAGGEGLAPLASSLGDATRIFKESATCRALFGDVFVDHYAATREWEFREYQKHVSDWELARYFEII